MVNVIIYGLLAGVIGTLTGGIISAVIGKKDKTISILFCIAAGIMLAIVCFDLIPDALEHSGLTTLFLSVLAGALIVILLDVIIEIKNPEIARASNGDPSKNNMAKAGFLMMLAIALHNFPEGLVIGSSEVVSNGLLMTILIGLHNIPEGIAVAAPLIAGGMKKSKAIFLTALTGLPTLFGAIAGYFIGLQSDVFVAVSLGVASGAMLCIIFSDMIPEAIKLNDSKATGYATFASFLVGIVLIIALA